MKRMILPLAMVFSVLFFSCGNSPAGTSAGETSGSSGDSSRQSGINPADKVPEFRDSIQSAPVAEYKVKTDNPLNDWYFKVQLFETHKTFNYLVKLQFEEVRGEDTLRLPNFGMDPQPVIHKGPEAYSCIVGFLDRDNRFREYKKIYVVGGALKEKTLKHYAVTTYRE